MNKRLISLLLLASTLLFGGLVTAQEANLTAECVDTYDAEVDYFPDKVEADYAQGWTVEYHNNYKIISALTPWPGSTPEDAFQYVLVQCGTPAPEGFDSAQIIEVPVSDTIALSTTYLPHLVSLGLIDHLVGLDSFLYLSTPEILEKIAAGELIEVGNGASINVEMVLDADPDLVISYGNGNPDFDAHPVLLDAGVPVVVASDYVETSPLGTAEWLKFVSLFYNAEGSANEIFDARAAEYQSLVDLTAEIDPADKPLVLWNSYTSYGEAWFIPGGESYTAQLVRDAGAVGVLEDDPQVAESNAGVPFDFEAAYEAGLDADYWVPQAFGVVTLGDLLALDERYADFAAIQNSTVFENNVRMNVNGGNDYYENGAANPQIILADLIHIFHPDLLPDHELVFFQHLN